MSQPVQEPEAVRLTLGDVVISDHWLVSPSGTVPVAEVQWSTQHLWQSHRRIPPPAIVAAVLTFWTLIGLLFLLAREERTSGSVQVTVSGPRFMHVMSFPVRSPGDAQRIEASVAQARQIAVMAA